MHGMNQLPDISIGLRKVDCSFDGFFTGTKKANTIYLYQVIKYALFWLL